MLKKILTKPWPSLLWTGIIFILLTMNTGTMESVPLFGIRNLDKLVHVFLFGMFIWLWCHHLLGSKPFPKWTFFLIIAAGIAYGVGMEFYQDRFTTREFELGDIYADIAGTFLGALLYAKK